MRCVCLELVINAGERALTRYNAHWMHWLTQYPHEQAAVFNASGRFVRKPFLELTEDDFVTSYNVSGYITSLLPRSPTAN